MNLIMDSEILSESAGVGPVAGGVRHFIGRSDLTPSSFSSASLYSSTLGYLIIIIEYKEADGEERVLRLFEN